MKKNLAGKRHQHNRAWNFFQVSPRGVLQLTDSSSPKSKCIDPQSNENTQWVLPALEVHVCVIKGLSTAARYIHRHKARACWNQVGNLGAQANRSITLGRRRLSAFVRSASLPSQANSSWPVSLRRHLTEGFGACPVHGLPPLTKPIRLYQGLMRWTYSIVNSQSSGPIFQPFNGVPATWLQYCQIQFRSI